MDNPNFSLSVKRALIALVAPLRDAARDPSLLREMLDGLGYTAALSGDPALAGIVSKAEAIGQAIEALDDASLDGWEPLVQLLQAGRNLQGLLGDLRQFAAASTPAQAAGGLADEVMGLLLASWLRREHPALFRIGATLGVIEAKGSAPLDAPVLVNGVTARYPRALDRFRFDAVSGLMAGPGHAIAQRYLPNGLAEAADAWTAGERLFTQLAWLAETLGLAWRIEHRPADGSPVLPPIVDLGGVDPAEIPDEDIEHDDAGDGTEVPDDPGPPAPPEYFAASFPTFVMRLAQPGASEIAIEVRASSARHAGGLPGYLLTPVGAFQQTHTGEQWTVAISARGAVPSVAIQASGVDLASGAQAVAGGEARIRVQRVSSGSPLIVGNSAGTRLELGAMDVDAALLFDTSRRALSLSAGAAKSALVIAPADGDSFLGGVLPAGGLRAEFDLGLAWASDKGLSLRGSAGLDATLPVGLSVAGVSLTSMNLGLRAQGGGLSAEVSANVAASIGPLKAVLDRVGIEAALSFPANGGNLGAADLALGFKGPSGVGVSVDAQGVLTGGGFLFHDAAQGLYAGAMQLSLHERITLKAFGLIATRMPDGSRGYSMLIFITAEDFQPIPLGLGFNLLGIGGMVGVNRTFDQDVLRQGLKNGSLATLLFPRDPVGNATALMRSLAAAFPARQGSYLLGILAKIGWFTPTLVLMDLALILEFGARQRLLALGRISALLPSASNDLVRLNMEAMGVIDFDAGTAAIDAVLVDSRLAHKFAITGAAALRAGFGSGPSFVLAVGGLNPHFAPPAGFPALDRVAIALSSGNNPRLVCEAYFAITSNTVQFGARASLYAGAAGFSIEGDVGFDVLVQLAPLHFIADYHARLQLKRGSHKLFMVEVAGEIEGPRPLRLSGKASFKIFWFHFSVRFDTTLVHGEAPPLPAAVDVLAQLKQALTAPAAWRIERTADHPHGVALRSLPASNTLVLDPLGRLSVTQQVVPLNTGRDVDTFGGAPVAGARRFGLAASLNGTALESQTQQASFAPAQFFTMSDDERLVAPSFETMDAGCTFGSAATKIDPAQAVAAPLGYRTITIGEAPALRANAAALADYMLGSGQLKTMSRSGAAARAPVRRVGRARFRNNTAAPAASLQPTHWSITPNADVAPLALDASLRTWSECRAELDTLNRARARWQMLPTHELEA